MLIIFDLDDTLIDTSGSITPLRLEIALQKMVAEGLAVPNFMEALLLLKRLDANAESGRNALSEFLELLGADERFFSIGVAEIYGDLPEDATVFPLEEAPEILKELHQLHDLALVSIGNPQQQATKMKKAGIDSTIFSKIVISEERDKKSHYQMIARELGYLPQETAVCGDRIAVDLLPAKELGYKTIQMRWGRGLSSFFPRGVVDFTMTEFKQIKEVIAKL